MNGRDETDENEVLKNALRGGEKLYPDTAKLAMEASLAVQDSSHQFLKLEDIEAMQNDMEINTSTRNRRNKTDPGDDK